MQNISPSQGVTLYFFTLLVLGTGKVGVVIFKTMKLRKSIKMMIPTLFPLAKYLKKNHFCGFNENFFKDSFLQFFVGSCDCFGYIGRCRCPINHKSKISIKEDKDSWILQNFMIWIMFKPFPFENKYSFDNLSHLQWSQKWN